MRNNNRERRIENIKKAVWGFAMAVSIFRASEIDANAEPINDERMVIEALQPTIMYITGTVNLRDIPTNKGAYLGTLHKDDEVKVVGMVTNNIWNKITYYVTDKNEFIHGNYISENKPVDVQLPVCNILQNPDLPNGCEVTSLSIVLNYKGYAVDKCDMADNYLPKCDTLLGDPEVEYLRNPRSKRGEDSGFYCFATCICNTVDNYNAANGTQISYGDLTGNEVSSLYKEIDSGNPCVVWGTLKWRTPKFYSNGLYSNLHCMVLKGYTDTTVTIADPIYGDTMINRNTFETVWQQMGSRAVVVY